MDGVIIQSSTLFANVYMFAPPGEIAAGANNTAATHLFILELTFCYDKDDPTEPAAVVVERHGIGATPDDRVTVVSSLS